MKGFGYHLIVDTSECQSTKRDGMVIPIKKRPGYIHFFQEDAEKEALRFAESCKWKGNGISEFMVFKAIKMARFDAHVGIFILEEAFED